MFEFELSMPAANWAEGRAASIASPVLGELGGSRRPDRLRLSLTPLPQNTCAQCMP